MRRSDELEFYEEEHEYILNGTQLTSVTEWVSGHWPQFDADTIGKYYARSLRNELKSFDGDENTLTEENFPKSAKFFGKTWKDEVISRKNKRIPVNSREIKRAWKENGEAAAAEGSRIHTLIEQAILQELDIVEYMDERMVVNAMGFYEDRMNTYGYDCAVMPEYRVYSEDLGLAGTIDVCIHNNQGQVVLIDWKTNKDIYKKGRNYGQTRATKGFRDDKLFLYTLQLSLYAYILEREYDVEVKALWIYWTTGEEAIEVDYEKEFIEEMLQEDERL